nr:unnamed protein product [Callosobruchus analis]
MSQPESEPSISQVYDLLKTVLDKNIEIKQEIIENKATLSQEIQELRKEFNAEFTKLKQENEDLKEENKALKNRLETVDRKLRKYNIVVYGLKEESEHKDIKQVLQTFNEILGVRCTETDFRDCHRIGTAQSRQVRPVLLETVSSKLKYEIFSKANKLKGSGIFIANDYTASDYHNRKHLFSNLKLAKSLNLDPKIERSYLIIGDTKFSVEFLKKIDHRYNNRGLPVDKGSSQSCSRSINYTKLFRNYHQQQWL